MEGNRDEQYMKQALQLAQKGEGYVAPNPMVGAVIVKDGRIIGSGYHEHYGGPHAEVNAIADAKEDVAGATMYVTLEPCSHYGKTPPCADLLVEKKLAKVVVGSLDPNPLVAGKGIQKLKEAGIEVVSGVRGRVQRNQPCVSSLYYNQTTICCNENSYDAGRENCNCHGRIAMDFRGSIS